MASEGYKNLLEVIDKQAKRNVHSQQQTLYLLDTVINMFDKASQQLTDLPEDNTPEQIFPNQSAMETETPLQQDAPPSRTNPVKVPLEKLHEQLTKLKPLSNLNKLHQHGYSRISKLSKHIDHVFRPEPHNNNDTVKSLKNFSRLSNHSNPSPNKQHSHMNNKSSRHARNSRPTLHTNGLLSDKNNNPSRPDNPENRRKFNPFPALDPKLLKLSIAQHFLKSGNLQAAKALDIVHPKLEVFQQAFKLYNQVLSGNYKHAIDWAATEKLYETYSSPLEFELRKREFLRIANISRKLNNKDINCPEQQQQLISSEFMFKQEAIEYCRCNMKKFMNNQIYMPQIEELMGYLVLFSEGDNSPLAQRYKRLQGLEEDNHQIAEKVLHQHFQRNGIGLLDSLDICVRAGLATQSGFARYQRLLYEPQIMSHKQALPFSVDLPSEFNYHSIFICPVSKEVSHAEDKPLVLKCGHVISEQSFSRIVDNRNKIKFKCPVCHTEQKLGDVVEMHF